VSYRCPSMAYRQDVKDEKVICPYCISEVFDSKIELRIHIAMYHFYDVLLDWKRYGPPLGQTLSEE